ncbi:ABC transporter ATP-binding protein [Lysinibacillus sp. 2017]|uniref:ABC transporter ATP-binding protein n=1 Tax=unclassified Lysinibacillus TaxID=2636778 RepID=UPI000D525A24|nr:MULTISPECIES: ABC transporter A family member [unclassified Lysinibacillus]AWE07209.1 ABC transporter ATP-binding protein [Lysinibacillus sp. 2017]TGN34667.1 ATP-binding cassette domain-containing protein [Lysinibacillus sp. S2017]
MQITISIEDLTKQYGDKIVVDHVSLSIKEGELFGLLGVNGAGKTTLIKMLCGLTKPTSGLATIVGKDIIQQREQIKKVIAVSPQETAIAPNLTVRENLELMAGIHGFSKKEMKEKIQYIIEVFSLHPYEKQKSKTLSGGWQRKLSIALALITEPQILFLDEPTLGLDVLGRRELWAVIEQLKKTTTIVLTTHYLEEASSLCDRICVMKSGQVKAIGTVHELIDMTKTQNFEDAFVEIVTKEAIL